MTSAGVRATQTTAGLLNVRSCVASHVAYDATMPLNRCLLTACARYLRLRFNISCHASAPWWKLPRSCRRRSHGDRQHTGRIRERGRNVRRRHSCGNAGRLLNRDAVTPLLLSCCTRSVVLYAACHLVALEVGPCTALTCVTRIHARHGTARVNATWHAACSTQHEPKHRRACSGLTPSLLTRLEATAQRGDGDGDGDGEAASARRPHHRLRLTPEVGTAARLFAAAPFREGEGENSFTAVARRQRMGGGCGIGPERRRAALS